MASPLPDIPLDPDVTFDPVQLEKEIQEGGRHPNQDLADLFRSEGEGREALRLEDCGVRGYDGECDCAKDHFLAFHCHSRYCQCGCQETEKKRLYAKYLDVVKDVLSRPVKYHSFRFLTLTIPTAEGITQETVLRLFEAWKVLRNWTYIPSPEDDKSFYVDPGYRKDGKRKKVKPLRVFPRGMGALVVWEVGKGSNPHLHVLYYAPNFLNYGRLWEAWREIWPGADNLDDKRLRGKTGRDPKRVLEYLLKYVTKACVTDPDKVIIIHRALKGRRRIRSYGAFYNVSPLPDPEPSVCEDCQAEIKWLFEEGLIRPGGETDAKRRKREGGERDEGLRKRYQERWPDGATPKEVYGY